MSIFKDIIDVTNDLLNSDAIKLLKKNSKNKSSSITRMSKEGVLHYPVIISRSIDLETATMINRALEREYTTVTMMAMNLNPIMDIGNADNIPDYIKRFHQNDETGGIKGSDMINALSSTNTGIQAGFLKESIGDIPETGSQEWKAWRRQQGDSEEKIEAISEEYSKKRESRLSKSKNVFTEGDFDSFMESYTPVHESDDSIIFFGEFVGDTKKLLETHHMNMTLESELLNHTILNDLTTRDSRASVKEYTGEEIADSKEDRERRRERRDIAKDRRDIGKDNRDQEMHDTQIRNSRRQSQRDFIKDRRDGELHTARMNDLRANANTRELPSRQLTDNDVKKANDMIASLVEIRIRLYDKDKGETLGHQDILIGIKAVMHPVTVEETIDNIQRALINGDKAFNFIRWTTGEISFFRDFLFQIDDIKTDVLNQSRGRSNWWIALKRKKVTKKFLASFKDGRTILPNATLVIGMDEVTILNEQYQIDLLNEQVSRKLMDELFLLGVTIVDDINKLAYFLYDGNRNYQVTSFSGLERENSKDQQKFNEMLKMLNRNY